MYQIQITRNDGSFPSEGEVRDFLSTLLADLGWEPMEPEAIDADLGLWMSEITEDMEMDLESDGECERTIGDLTLYCEMG